MNLISVFVLSAIEGITEFLPISSTGHLILASKLLGIEGIDFVKTFEIVIQLGAILAVVVLYWKKFFVSIDIYKKLLLAFLPTAIVGFTLYPLIKNFLLGSAYVVVISLFLGGMFMVFFEKYFKHNKDKKITYKNYLLIGLFQSISVIPGVSRAMATIMGGMYTGLTREEATEFSFLLAIPTMMAATALDLYKSRDLITSSSISTLSLGTGLSFLFALLAIKFLINYVKKHDFKVFGIYRMALSAVYYFLFIS